MIRLLKTALCAALAAGALAATATAAEPAGSDSPRVERLRVIAERASSASSARPSAGAASVKVDGCTSNSVPASRAYLLSASANSVSGAKSVRVRFHLFVKAPGKPEEEIKIATGNRLGAWEEPVSIGSGGVGSVKFVKRIYRLSAPAAYRAAVDFEWYSASGGKGTRKRSQTVNARSCTQADLRPDLQVSSATVTPVNSTRARVAIGIVNKGNGRSAAGTVRLFVPGAGSGTGAVNLALGRIDEQGTRRKPTNSDPLVLSRTLTVEVARCAPGSAMSVEIDPAGVIGERTVSDNYLQIGCLALN
ncbi:MAG: hypothetical protein WCO96_09500 [Actinomycetes bacterium]